MKKHILVLLMVLLCLVPAAAEKQEKIKQTPSAPLQVLGNPLLMQSMLLQTQREPQLVQRNPLLDAAFSMLEKGNPILEAYNRITGADIQPYFEDGLPYFFGGRHEFSFHGITYMFYKYPDYAKRNVWEDSGFYVKGRHYLFGLDCCGYTNWIFSEVGWPAHDSLSRILDWYGVYGDRYIHNFRTKEGMPPYGKLAETLQVGDMLLARKDSNHIMMYIGTLREYGFTAESAPELANYLDYALVIHCGRHPDYYHRTKKWVEDHSDDPYYSDVYPTYGGVSVSIVGIVPTDAPHHEKVEYVHYYWYDLDGYKLTTWEKENATSWCWYRHEPTE